MSKKIKALPQKFVFLNKLPFDLFTTQILPFLDGMDVYNLHMTCRRYRGVYKHMSDVVAPNVPYPMWPLIQNKYCWVCETRCKKRVKPEDKFFVHAKCRSSCMDNTYYSVRDGELMSGRSYDFYGNYVIVVGPCYNGIWWNARFTAKSVLSQYMRDPEVEFQKRFKYAIGRAISHVKYSYHLAKMDAKFAGRKGKINITPKALPALYIDCYKHLLGRVKYMTSTEIQEYLDKSQHNITDLYHWYREAVRSKFIWADYQDWTSTCSYILNDYNWYPKWLNDIGNSSTDEIKQKIIKGLPQYISRHLSMTMNQSCNWALIDHQRSTCACIGCQIFASEMFVTISNISNEDNVIFSIDIGDDDGTKFGCLPTKSLEIQREFKAKFTEMYITFYQLYLKLKPNPLQCPPVGIQPPKNELLETIMTIGYKCVRFDLNLKTTTEMIPKYGISAVVEAFKNDDPSKIAQSLIKLN